MMLVTESTGGINDLKVTGLLMQALKSSRSIVQAVHMIIVFGTAIALLGYTYWRSRQF